MMYNEFTERTGFYPDANLYATIEEAYYDFDGDKNQFCEAYKANKDGIAEMIARAACRKASRVLEKKDREIWEVRDDLKQAEAKIKSLEAKVDSLLEWTPYIDKNAVSQERYDHLRQTGRMMTDDEAATWIADEWGFAKGKIKIIHTKPVLEVSRMHTIRKVGEVARDPYYEATDWYYVAFQVCGMIYEAFNGSLKQV